MSDNISVTQGFGTVMATDNIGGVHYPRSKLVFGQDGSQQDVSINAPLPVTLGGDLDGLAKEETLAAINQKVATEDSLAAVLAKLNDLATQATLASIDGKVATQTTLASIDGKVATQATLASIDGKVATQATLASIDGKIGAFATESTLSAVDAKAASINGKIDVLATEATLSSINGKINALATEQTLSDIEDILKEVRDAVAATKPTVARQLSAGATSASTALTSTVRRISIHASGASIRYAVGAGSQTASSASHFIAEGERLTIGVPASASIAAIRAGSVDGVLEISELT